jgi:hypothetical protein
MNELDGAQLQLEMGKRVILVAAIIDAALPVLVRKAGVGQRTQREQGAHEKLCQPKAKAHLESFLLVFCSEVNSFPRAIQLGRHWCP